MNNSTIFKAAHAVAKANKKAFGGDYVVYLKLALIATYGFVAKGATKESLFAAANRKLASVGIAAAFTKKVVVKARHGLVSFKKEYELKKAAKNLDAGKEFGAIFFSNGMFNAWINSESSVEKAY